MRQFTVSNTGLDISVCVSVFRFFNENVQCGGNGKGILADTRFLKYHHIILKCDRHLNPTIILVS
jgi:hypothetical protein